MNIKRSISAILIICLLCSAGYAGERESLVKEIKKLQKEQKMALKKASFYQHQAFDRQFSKKESSEVKRLRRKVAMWQIRAKELEAVIESKQSRLYEQE